MASIIPKIRTKFGEGIGVQILVSPPNIAENNRTFIATDAASGASSFTVDNGLKFAISQYVVIGALGAEKSELKQIHASTAPTASAITLTGADSFAHNRGEQITFIPYNQIIIERSTDSGASYSTLATVDIRADSTETFYQHTAGASTDYYRVKFSNSTSSDVSSYSDGLIATGFADNSVGNIIREAMVSVGEKYDQIITREFMIGAINEARDEMDKAPGAERWSFRTAFDYTAGNVIPGHDRLTLPTNLREPNTYKNILSVRIGRDGLSLNAVDKKALNRWYEGVARSALNGAITTGSTSIVLDDSGDFDESGDVIIAGAAITDTLDTVAYTTNTESTNTLGTVTGIQAAGHADDAIVWQGASFGYPTEYSVFEGILRFSQPFDDDLAGQNIYLDYYKDLTRVDSDGDTFDEPYYRIYIPYLRWRMKKRRNNELVADNDSDYKEWVTKANATVQKEFLGQDIRIVVDIP